MRSLIALAAAMLCLPVCAAQETPPSSASRASQPAAGKVFRLHITPAAQPVPSLKYQLMPPLPDQTPGNAAMLYETVVEGMTHNVSPQQFDQIERLLAADLKEVTRQAVTGLPSAAPDLEIAARRERCDWELPWRERGVSLVIPYLGRYRQACRILALDIRLSIAEGRYDDALHDLQTGFAFAHHTQGGTIESITIADLVSISMLSILNNQVIDLIGSPGSPNLYWALATVPRPFANLWPAMQMERALWQSSIPALKNVEKAQLTDEQWRDVLRQIQNAFGLPRGPDFLPPDLGLAAFVAAGYPPAKQYLLAHGYSEQQVENMPVIQVVLIHQVNQYSQWADEEFRWFSLPFPQAYLGLEKWEASFTQAVKQKKVGFLAQFTLPIISHAYLRTTLADRQIAALQCIEAIRLYAADHAGQLPRRLQDITEVPVPENPATGKPFGYTVNGNTAVLEAVSPEPTQEHLERYELILDSSKPAAASTDAKGDAQ